jgi:hypothetical protein
MFKKILIANRGQNVRLAGVSAEPDRLSRGARAGDLDPIEVHHV